MRGRAASRLQRDPTRSRRPTVRQKVCAEERGIPNASAPHPPCEKRKDRERADCVRHSAPTQTVARRDPTCGTARRPRNAGKATGRFSSVAIAPFCRGTTRPVPAPTRAPTQPHKPRKTAPASLYIATNDTTTAKEHQSKKEQCDLTYKPPLV